MLVKNRLQAVLGLAAAAVCALILYQHLFPNDERVIRRRLDRLAAITSVPDNPGLTSTLAAADRLRDYLTSDAEIEIERPGERRYTLTGRQDIIQTWVATRSSLAGLKVSFVDLEVVLDPGRRAATAQVTVRATQASQRDSFVQEFKLQLTKEDGQWRIRRAETVRTLKL